MRKLLPPLLTCLALLGMCGLIVGCGQTRPPGHQSGHPGNPPAHAPAHGQRNR